MSKLNLKFKIVFFFYNLIKRFNFLSLESNGMLYAIYITQILNQKVDIKEKYSTKNIRQKGFELN